MTKTPFITADKLEQITAEFPTPFHLYDEKGIRETARAVNAAFSWNPGFKEFFAVKATPNPAILKISFSWKRLQGFLTPFLCALTQEVSSLLVLISWIILKNQNLG